MKHIKLTVSLLLFSAIMLFASGTARATLCYPDADLDGYGDVHSAGVVMPSCGTGFSDNNLDCDDANPAVHPTAAEICNGMDDDCDGLVDNNAVDATTWYPDADFDSYGANGGAIQACAPPPGYVAQSGDCDDATSSTYPGATEFCNGMDDNCNSLVDDNAVDASIWYPDADVDGFGSTSGAILACSPPNGYVSSTGDCDDANSSVWPGNNEVCDGADNNCDGQVDNNAIDAPTWYPDADLDSFGSNSSGIVTCNPPNGYSGATGDCDDANPAIFPGANEVCNGMDDNCNGQVDEGCGCMVTLTGDLNATGSITSADIIGEVNYCFKGGATPPPCAAVADVNCTGGVTSADIIYLVNYVFKGGVAPCDVCTLIPGTWTCP